MTINTTQGLKDGDHCVVVKDTHKGQSGPVKDIHLSKTGHITITIVEDNVCFLKPSEKMWKFPNESMRSLKHS